MRKCDGAKNEVALGTTRAATIAGSDKFTASTVKSITALYYMQVGHVVRGDTRWMHS